MRLLLLMLAALLCLSIGGSIDEDERYDKYEYFVYDRVLIDIAVLTDPSTLPVGDALGEFKPWIYLTSEAGQFFIQSIDNNLLALALPVKGNINLLIGASSGPGAGEYVLYVKETSSSIHSF